MITIRRAVYEDIPRIMQFIDEHWKKGHILARNREFFEWQFVDKGIVNFFLGIDDEVNKIYGILGVIVYNEGDNPDISGTIWKTIKSDNPMLGIEIDRYMYFQLHARYACSAGISNKAVRVHQMLGKKVTSMDHYYRLGNFEEYQIAKINKKFIPEVEDTEFFLERIHTVDEMQWVIPEEELRKNVMSKDYHYIQKRYFNHPIYHYDIWKIMEKKGKPVSIIITREEYVRKRKICKIIDYYGKIEVFSKITSALDNLMAEKGYEYIDIYSFGVEKEIYEQAGFIRCDEDDCNIIPNYFHPFEQKNVSLNMIDPQIDGLRLFRGDGDQDRPC